jgi:uncharacterized protein YecT (DUF1311 family)
MKRLIVSIALLTSPTLCDAQKSTQAAARDVDPGQLQSILALPLSQAVAERERYKQPLKVAYGHQLASIGKDCEAVDGQQPYNICMGKAGVQADADFGIFYNNLQMLCHDQNQLATLQASERDWQRYRDSAMQAAHAAWSEGTGAPGFAGKVYLSLVRDRMKELYGIYSLNISQ